MDDLAILKPTIFVSVPRLLNKVYDKVILSLKEKSFWKRWLFYKGLNAKLYYLQRDGIVDHAYYDHYVFN